MTITLLFYSVLRERFRTAERTLQVEGDRTIRDIFLGLPELASNRPLGERLLGGIRLARNCEYVPPQTAVVDGDEIAFIPPVSGG